MHYYALVVIPADGDLTERVAEAMEPVREDDDTMGLWDWYQIGGRYTGRLSGYDAFSDPDNRERCFLCGGTGKRMDEIGVQHRLANPGYTCNGCDGAGRRIKHASQFAPHDGDVVPADEFLTRLPEMDDELMPYAVIVHGSEVPAYVREAWNGDTFVEQHDKASMRRVLAQNLTARRDAGLKDLVVVVDYHC